MVWFFRWRARHCYPLNACLTYWTGQFSILGETYIILFLCWFFFFSEVFLFEEHTKWGLRSDAAFWVYCVCQSIFLGRLGIKILPSFKRCPSSRSNFLVEKPNAWFSTFKNIRFAVRKLSQIQFQTSWRQRNLYMKYSHTIMYFICDYGRYAGLKKADLRAFLMKWHLHINSLLNASFSDYPTWLVLV